MTHDCLAKRTCHIYVLNDEQVLLDVIRDLLEDEGYRVTTDTFADQLIAAQHRRMLVDVPDLIVLDFLVGGEPIGWQFLQLLRLSPETAGIPVILCTAARGVVEEIEAHLREMHVHVILKPFDIDDLLRAVALALEPVAAS